MIAASLTGCPIRCSRRARDVARGERCISRVLRARVRASADDTAAPEGAADAEALLRWAAGDGVRLSPKVTAGSPTVGGSRGLVALEPIDAGEDLIVLPNSCTCFDATFARGDRQLGIADAVAAYEAAPDRGGDVTDEVALTLLVILARRHPDATPFGPYALALPRDPPDTPLLFPDERLRAVVPILPLALVDAVDDARQELFQLWDVAAAVIDRVVFPGGEGTPAGTPEPPLDVDEFAFAWLAVRSRAITFTVRRADGGVDARRCMVPVVDLMNHACAPAPATASTEEASAEGAHRGAHSGPAAREERREDAVAWVADRPVPAGAEVTWTYGHLSNESLWLWYGFVPDPPVHAGTSVTFHLPAGAFRGGLASVASSDDSRAAVAREDLLVRAGVFDRPRRGGAPDDADQRALAFELRLGDAPRVLAGIAGLMCCAPEEAIAIADAVANSFGGCVMDEEEEEDDEGATARVDASGRVRVRLLPESRRRAGRYVAYVLAQVEPVVLASDETGDGTGDGATGDGATGDGATGDGATGDGVTGDGNGNDIGADAGTRAAAARVRAGAERTFRSLDDSLTDDALLTGGEWIDEAVSKILVAY